MLFRTPPLLWNIGYNLVLNAMNILHIGIKLNIFSALVFSDGAGFFVWLLGVIFHRVFFEDFILLCVVPRDIQQ